MEYIKGRCHTNLDDYDCSLVKSFYRVPNIGERVEVRYKGNRTSLKIVQITHEAMFDGTPFLSIELHN